MRNLPFQLLCALAILLSSAQGAETGDFESCHASWDGSRLVMANRFVQREWQWKNGQFFATSFRDLESGTEWLDPKQSTPSPAPKNASLSGPGTLKFSTRNGAMTPVQAPSLVVELASTASVTYRFQIFPEARGVLMQTIEPSAAIKGENNSRKCVARYGADRG